MEEKIIINEIDPKEAGSGEPTKTVLHQTKRKLTKKIDRGLILSILILLLIIISGLQAIQLSTLRGKIINGAIKPASASSLDNTSTSNNSTTMSDMQNLPNQSGMSDMPNQSGGC